MNYDIRTIAFLAEILHPPMDLEAKAIQNLHAELFDIPELAYRNFTLAPDGIHMTNLVDQPGAVSSVSFLIDRVQFREEMTGLTVEEFGKRVRGVLERVIPARNLPLATGQQFIVRSLLNPRHFQDSRDFLARAVCKIDPSHLEPFQRPPGLFGLKLVFPQLPQDPSLFSLRIESFNQDPRSIFVENVGTFTHCVLPQGIGELLANLERTYAFLDEKATAFLARFDHPTQDGPGETGQGLE